MTILDASAVLALLQSEEGGDVVAAELPTASMSAVNLSEVWQKLQHHGLDSNLLTAGLQALGVSVLPFTHDDAVGAAQLWTSTRSRGLSLADRACLALGLRLHQDVLTADRSWAGLDVGVVVRHLR